MVRRGVAPVELVALLKAVPRSESNRYDPIRRAQVRDDADLLVNPFDQRALRVALELRRSGEKVTVLSLGPPGAGPLLREARAAGADRAIHLCDAAFAGSDLLATSEVLVAALHRFRWDLVLTGARSTDSDTGLTAPEVAGRLGVPIVSGARRLRRAVGDGPLEVDLDTTDGWATASVDAPAVISLGEKIAKPLQVTPEQFDRTPATGVERLGAEAIGLSPAEVGAFGSPTSVVAVAPVAPARAGLRFGDGGIADRVREAVAALRPLLRRRAIPPSPLPWPPSFEPDRELLVLASGPHGSLEPAALATVTHLRRSLPSHSVMAAWYGRAPDAGVRQRLESAGVLGGHIAEPSSGAFDSGDVARGLASVLDLRPKATVVAVPATPFGREVAGQLAAGLSLGVVADAIAVTALPDGTLEWSKPSFGGATIASVRCRSAPVVVTVPPGLTEPALEARGPSPSRWAAVEVPTPRARVRRGGETAEGAPGPEPEGAAVLVAVGMGVRGPEGIARLLPSVARWHGAVVGTRRVVDAGWLPVRRQAGLTGRAFGPRLAVLLGVRGTPNHMVAWARAGAVLAVNLDPDAPVFRAADVGIVGAAEEVVPALEAPLAEALASAEGP